MAIKCCESFTGKEAYDCDKDGARLKEGVCYCKCHTSPVSEVIAKAIADYGQKFGGYGVQPPEWPRNDKESREHEWLRTTLNRVASVAREEGFGEGAETARHNLLQEMKPNFARDEEFYKEGRKAMLEKILAALPNYEFDDNLQSIRCIITDLK